MLGKLPADIAELAVWATIHDAERKRQDFGKVKNSLSRSATPGRRTLPLSIDGRFAGKTTIQVASFLRQPDGSWTFHALGAGSNAGLGEIIQAYLG